MLDSLWSKILEAASRKLPPAVIDTWLRPSRLLALEGDHLRVGVPNVFSRDWLVQHHLDSMQRAASDVLGGQPRVTIVVDDSLAPSDDTPPPPTGRTAVAGTMEGLNPKYTFDTFVVGSSNQFAQAASQAVAELPSRPTTRSSSTAGSASARPTCCTRSVTRRRGCSRESPSRTSRPNASPTS